jgi:uncharacterized membrane protein YkgB
MNSARANFEAFDVRLTRWTARRAISLLRWSVGLVFLWFGVLKFGASPIRVGSQ